MNQNIVELQSISARRWMLLVEVLSESTSIHDRGIKSVGYRMIPSLREILLVEQKAPQVEVYFRNDSGRWESDIYIDLKQTITLRSLDIMVAMEEIYRKVKFPDAPSSAIPSIEP